MTKSSMKSSSITQYPSHSCEWNLHTYTCNSCCYHCHCRCCFGCKCLPRKVRGFIAFHFCRVKCTCTVYTRYNCCFCGSNAYRSCLCLCEIWPPYQFGLWIKRLVATEASNILVGTIIEEVSPPNLNISFSQTCQLFIRFTHNYSYCTHQQIK